MSSCRVAVACLAIMTQCVLVSPAPAQQSPRLEPPAGVTLHADLEYARAGEHRLYLDICLPNQPAIPRLPVIAYIHGGGWMSGNKNHAWQRGWWSYAATNRYAVVSIGYRLSGVAPWPACLHDCKAAVRWLKTNAEKYGLDGERIAVAGHSAGGHLTAMLCTTSDVAALEGELGPRGPSSRVACGVDEAGPSDFAGYMDYTRPENGLPSPRLRNSPEARLLGGLLTDRVDAMREASATTHASAHDSPVMIVHGSEDTVVPINQAELLEAALKKVGVEVVYIRLNGMGHSVSGTEYLSRRNLFFEKHLHGREVEVNGGVFDARTPSVVSRDTPLGKLAQSLKSGEWGELKTTGLHVGTQQAFGRAEGGVWNPRTQELLVVARHDNVPPEFWSYAANSNAWRQLPRPDWWNPNRSELLAGTSWDNTSIDTRRGLIYHHVPTSGDVFYKSIDNTSPAWSPLRRLPPIREFDGGTALVYYEELNGLLRIHNGAVHLLQRTTPDWSAIAERLEMGAANHVAEYDPVHQLVIFGGGKQSNRLYKLATDRKAVPLAAPPLQEISSTASAVTVDPVAGHLIVVDEATGQTVAYDTQSDRWERVAATPPGLPPHHLVSASASTYGVSLFARDDGTLLVYKHRAAR